MVTWAQNINYPFMELKIPNYERELVNKNAAFIENFGQLGVFGQPGVAANQVLYYSAQPDFCDFVLRDRLAFVSAHNVDSVGVLYDVNRLDVLFYNDDLQEHQILQTTPYLLGHAKRHYYTGLTTSGIENVLQYGEIYVKSLYPGIDMSLSHNKKGLRAYFKVEVGYNPLSVKMEFDGLTSLNFSNGNLNIGSYQSTYQFHKPVAYQIDTSNNITVIPVTWAIDVNGRAFFNVGTYDTSRDLFFGVKQGDDTVDPKDVGDNLEWSSYIGEVGVNTMYSVTTDEQGNVFYAGVANDINFAVNIGFQANVPYADGGDAFLIKFNENIEPQWYTFIGGDISTAANMNASDVARSISSYNANEIIMTGTSASTNLPMVDVSGGGYNGDQTNDISSDPNCDDCVDIFYARFNSSGILQYSTYYGGEDQELPIEIMNKNGSVYIVGERSSSTPLFTQSGASNFTDGTGFIMKMSSTNQLVWFNSFNVDRIMAATKNENNHLIVGGYIHQNKTLPSANPSTDPNFNAHNGSDFDGFIAVFDQNDVLTHTAYYGGECQDVITDLQTDFLTNTTYGVGAAFAYSGDVGCTNYGSGDIPIIGNGLARASFGGADHVYFGFTIPQASTPLNFTLSGYFSGDGEELGTFTNFGILWTRPSISVLKNGDFAISGMSNSGIDSLGAKIPFPTNNPLNFYEELSNNTIGTLLGQDAYIAVFDANHTLRYTTFFGHGRYSDGPSELHYTNVNNKNRLYFAGNTGTINSATMPLNERLYTEPYESGSLYNDYYRQFGPVNLSQFYAGWGAFLTMDGLYDVLSTDELNKQHPGVKIYPNPTIDQLNIQALEAIEKAEVYTVQGQLVCTEKGTGKNMELDIPFLAAGNYLLKVHTASRVVYAKFVKQ